MERLREAGALEPVWVQPRWMRREYELRAGDDVLATLRWAKWYGPRAVAEAAEGRWAFGPRGLLQSRIVVRAEETQSDLATLRLGWRGAGSLDLGDGRAFRWNNTSFWRSEWAFLDEAGEKRVSFRPRRRGFRHEIGVAIDPAALATRELSLLVALGAYLMLLMAGRRAAA